MKKIYILFTALFLWPVLNFAQNADSCEVATELTGDGTYTVSDLMGSSGTQGYASAWYYYTPAEGGTINISSCGSGGIDTRLYVHTGDCSALVLYDNDDDGCLAPSTYSSVLVDVPVTSGTTYYIEWDARWEATGFDFEFSFVPTPTCDNLSGLATSAVSDVEVTFNWNPDGNTSWDYAVDVTGFDIGTATVTTTADTFATVSALTSGTFYDVYVRTNCGGDLGAWDMLTFRTIGEGDNCTLPIVVDLDADLPYADLGQFTCGRGVPYNSSCLGSYDGGESVVYRLDLASTMTIKIAMDPNGTTWSGLGLFDDCPDVGACIAIATGGSSAVREIVSTLDAGTYYVMVSTWPSPNCIPVLDLTIEQLLCDDISGLGLNSVTTTDAVINWNSDGNTSWDYAVDVAGFDIGTATLTTVADTFFTATPLVENTSYEAYVRTNCGAELGDWAILAFNTPMTPINGDSCEVATVIVDNGVYNCSPLIGSGTTIYEAAWFSYTPTMDGSIDVYSCYGGSDTFLWIWSGDCDNLVAVASNDDECIHATDSTGSAYAAALYGVNVVAGTTYYMEWTARWDEGPFFFNFEYSEVVIEYPVNNTCDGATITDVSVGTMASANGDGTGATASAGFPVAEVWEAFTLTECADVTIDFCGSDPMAVTLYINLFDACPITASLPTGTVTFIECAGNDSAQSIFFPGIEAGTYYYPVLADIDNYNGFGPYTINYTAVSCEPASDTCSTFLGGPWTDFNGTFGGAPVAVDGVCPFNELTAFEVWASESYTVDGFVNGETYTFSMCNGSYGAWAAELSVWDENGDMIAFLSDTCSISWTATYDGTYVIGINEVGACGSLSSNTSTDNGFPALTCEGANSVEDITLANFTVYPNPNNGQFSIVNEGVNGNYIIELIDVTGRVVYSEQVQMNSNDRTEINSNDVNTGVYLVKMTNTDENYYRTLRMIIK